MGKFTARVLLGVAATIVMMLACDEKKSEIQTPAVTTTEVVEGVTTFERLYEQEKASTGGIVVVIAPAGGYLVAGSFRGVNKQDQAYLLRIDSLGEVIWEKWYAQAKPLWVADVVATEDGGFLLACQSTGFEDESDSRASIVLFKIDSLGLYQWENTISSEGNELVTGLEGRSDGSYLLTGASVVYETGESAGFLAGISSTAIMQWKRSFEEQKVEVMFDQQQLPDGGYLLVGSTTDQEPTTNQDVIVLRTDASGDVIWDEQLGGDRKDVVHSLDLSTDGNCFLTGVTSSEGFGSDDVLLAKMSLDGDIIWKKTFGGPASDIGMSVAATLDGGCAVAGMSASKGSGVLKVYLIRVDEAGRLQWERAFHTGNSHNARSVVATSDGGLVVAAAARKPRSSSWLTYVIKTDANGNCVNSTANIK